ncbi:MAG TPA: hypothetical protein VNN15_02620 [Solirubrobacterales bacterium]|nr:hypothetical protein [Solirubrobacterales bacterium]
MKTRRPVSSWVEKKYSDDELLRILREANEALGGILTSDGYNDFARGRTFPDGRPWPTHQTHFHRFGSWRKALLAAGLAANPSSAIAGQRIFDQSHCLDAIRHAHRELGETPSISDYEAISKASNGALPSAATVRNRCGSWSQAVHLAQLD